LKAKRKELPTQNKATETNCATVYSGTIRIVQIVRRDRLGVISKRRVRIRVQSRTLAAQVPLADEAI